MDRCAPISANPAGPPGTAAGLEASALYRDLETGQCHLGAVLLETGIHFPDAADFSSMLVRLARVP